VSTTEQPRVNSLPSLTTLAEIVQQCHDDSIRWFPECHEVIHHTLGLTGEAGEFANKVKKLHRGTDDIHDARTRYELVMELADVLIYTANIAALLKVDLAKAYAQKRMINERRFGNSGEAEQASD